MKNYVVKAYLKNIMIVMLFCSFMLSMFIGCKIPNNGKQQFGIARE